MPRCFCHFLVPLWVCFSCRKGAHGAAQVFSCRNGHGRQIRAPSREASPWWSRPATLPSSSWRRWCSLHPTFAPLLRRQLSQRERFLHRFRNRLQRQRRLPNRRRRWLRHRRRKRWRRLRRRLHLQQRRHRRQRQRRRLRHSSNRRQ